jgi:pyrimidine operon attenuation protein / uracil phosphoribosyltransferase
MDIAAPLNQLLIQVRAYLAARHGYRVHLLGIQRGGVWLAQYLQKELHIDSALGSLDISFYRDDFATNGMQPIVHPSNIPFSIDGTHILLVDDILYTGRTIRAALNEVFDYGRPASVGLAVLIERDGRELPIAADCVGAKLALKTGQLLKLRGPDPLRLELIQIASKS